MKIEPLSREQLLEQDVVRAFLVSTIEASEPLDSAATWLLGGIGLATALAIPNLQSLATVLEKHEIQIGILILVLAGIAGLWQKVIALRLKLFIQIEERIRQRLVEVARETDPPPEIDVESVIERVCSAFPRFFGNRLKMRMKTGLKDPLAAYRLGARMLVWQNATAAAEFILFVSFIAIFTVSLEVA